jgi:hypothetical protein
VLLATDGDFNVGVTDFEQLKDLVESERESGVQLSTLGFGTGNYNEHLMEQAADELDRHSRFLRRITRAYARDVRNGPSNAAMLDWAADLEDAVGGALDEFGGQSDG